MIDKRTLTNQLTRAGWIFLTLCPLLLLSGCAGMVVGGAVGVGMAATDRRTVGTLIEDQTIEAKLLQALKDEPELNRQTHIQVTSYNQSVLLSGEAPTPELAEWATRIARRIAKVKQVHNEIILSEPASFADRSRDTLLTTQVKTQLLGVKLPDFYPIQIKVVTANKTVFLMGLVNPREAEAVVDAVRQVGGVDLVVKLFEIGNYGAYP